MGNSRPEPGYREPIARKYAAIPAWVVLPVDPGAKSLSWTRAGADWIRQPAMNPGCDWSMQPTRCSGLDGRRTAPGVAGDDSTRASGIRLEPAPPEPDPARGGVNRENGRSARPGTFRPG